MIAFIAKLRQFDSFHLMALRTERKGYGALEEKAHETKLNQSRPKNVNQADFPRGRIGIEWH